MNLLSSVNINRGKVECNGKIFFQTAAKSEPEFFKALYSHLDLSYPKFFKMDEVCKLYFLGVEILLQESEWTAGAGDKTDQIIGTTSGCLYSDLRHSAVLSAKSGTTPSPANFVYTLPNIMLGEVCIRHGIKGKTDCFVMDNYDESFLDGYAKQTMKAKETENCIGGFVNYEPGNYSCFLRLYAKR